MAVSAHSLPPQVPCILAASLLQYTFLCAAAFLLLESLIVLHKLVDAVILPILESGIFVVAVGFLLPAIYTGITMPLLYSYILPESDTTLVKTLILSHNTTFACLRNSYIIFPKV